MHGTGGCNAELGIADINADRAESAAESADGSDDEQRQRKSWQQLRAATVCRQYVMLYADDVAPDYAWRLGPGRYWYDMYQVPMNADEQTLRQHVNMVRIYHMAHSRVKHNCSCSCSLVNDLT